MSALHKQAAVLGLLKADNLELGAPISAPGHCDHA